MSSELLLCDCQRVKDDTFGHNKRKFKCSKQWKELSPLFHYSKFCFFFINKKNWSLKAVGFVGD